MNPMYSGNPALKIISILHLHTRSPPPLFLGAILKAIPRHHVILTTDVQCASVYIFFSPITLMLLLHLRKVTIL